MDLRLQTRSGTNESAVKISGSKSETNRLLLLQALHPGIKLLNISDSDDSKLMASALSSAASIIDIGHAGTAMRFLTAYFSMQQNRTVLLTGSDRMKQRPIKILVDAMRALGADISYVENEGFPPLRISGRLLQGGTIAIDSTVSSQYVSALLLIGASLQNGLELTLEGTTASTPYIDMTVELLREIGVEAATVGNVISVQPVTNALPPKTLTIESDWSSASYFYSIVALSDIGTRLQLSRFKPNSRQGDSELAHIYKSFGVETIYDADSLTLTKKHVTSHFYNFDLSGTPDIAQTIAVTCFGLGNGCELTGLNTLKIKETDRLTALRTELEKLGAHVAITSNSLTLQTSTQINPGIAINTYDDHRMAMAFAPLALKVPIIINNAEVVSKSYPTFWEDLKKIGFGLENGLM